MDDETKKEALQSKINTDNDLVVFSEEQLSAFNSGIIDNLDEALDVLEKENGNSYVKNTKGQH